MLNNLKKNLLLSSVSAVGMAVCASTALGQSVSTASEAEMLENPGEIVVTAQKRAERLIDVPMSITAATGEQLAKQGVTDPSQLTKVVPGFVYLPSTYSTPIYTIRGIGFNDFTAGAEPTVTTYIDQVPLPYPIMTRGAALDIERVEVLKGPQGTLFGNNSTGGAINFIAAKPTRDLRYGASLEYGRFNNAIISGFVSGPLSGTLGARLAVSHESADGWQYSTTRPGDRLGSENFTNARLSFDWQPSDVVRFALTLSGWHDSGETPAGQFQEFRPKTPPTPFTQFIFDGFAAEPVAPRKNRAANWDPNVDFSRDDTLYQIALQGTWDVQPDISLTSITAYTHMRGNDPVDSDGSAVANFRWTEQNILLTSLSQELRLAGSSGALRWMLGGNYLRQVANQNNFAVLESTSTVLPTADGLGAVYIDTVRNQVNQQPTTLSAFGSLEYELSQQLTVQGSIRYSDQRRSFRGCSADNGPGPNGISAGEGFAGFSEFLQSIVFGQVTPVTIAPGGCFTLDSVTLLPGQVRRKVNEDNVSWRASVNWKPNRDSLLYANITKGYKAGSFSLVGGSVSDQYDPIKQESVLAYEAGFKVNLLDRRLELSGAGFYYDYRNKQLQGTKIFPVFQAQPILVNVPKSRVAGAEINIMARPTDRLTLNGGMTYVNSRVRTNPDTNTPPLDGFGNPTSYIGRPFPNTPQWQGVGDVEYQFPLGDGLTGFAGSTLTFRSASYAAFGGNPEFRINSYALLDLRAGVETRDGRWRAQVWGRNITNKYYWNGVNYLVDAVERRAGNPVTYGVTISYRY